MRGEERMGGKARAGSVRSAEGAVDRAAAAGDSEIKQRGAEREGCGAQSRAVAQ